MTDHTPGEIRLRRRALTVLRHVLITAWPDEGCALLLGEAIRPPMAASSLLPSIPETRSGGSALPISGADAVAAPLEIQLIWPCLNAWEPACERTRRFRLDPREQLLAQRWGRGRGLQVLGAAHSHPISAAVPSATDLELAVAPTLQLILSPLQDWAPSCWWLEAGSDGSPRPRRLQWKLVY